MTPQLRDIINDAWDACEDDPTRDIRVMPDAVVAEQLGIPKWRVIAARRGYRRRQHHGPHEVRTVLDSSAASGFCSTTFRFVDISLPRLRFLEGAHAA